MESGQCAMRSIFTPCFLWSRSSWARKCIWKCSVSVMMYQCPMLNLAAGLLLIAFLQEKKKKLTYFANVEVTGTSAHFNFWQNSTPVSLLARESWFNFVRVRKERWDWAVCASIVQVTKLWTCCFDLGKTGESWECGTNTCTFPFSYYVDSFPKKSLSSYVFSPNSPLPLSPFDPLSFIALLPVWPTKISNRGPSTWRW